MPDEKLCLNWSDFQDLVKVSFGDLRTDKDFTDVTLACEDQSIKAHKVVLSACSPFFKKLLKTHSHPQPLIYMKGIKASSLAAIIDFLYLGEANVFQEDLDNFLALAEELQLKGLEGNSEENVPEHLTGTFNHTEKVVSFPNPLAPGRYMSVGEPDYEKGTDVRQKEDMPEKRISKVKFENEADLFKGTGMMTYQQKPRLDLIIEPATMAKIDSMIEKHVDGYYCTNCGHISKQLCHMREHVEKHIEGLEFPCNSCNKILRSSNSLRCHKKRSCPFRNSSQE